MVDERQHVVYKFDEQNEEIISFGASQEKSKKTKLCYGLLFLIILAALATITTGIVLLKSSSHNNATNDSTKPSQNKNSETCKHTKMSKVQKFCRESNEAQQNGLKKFLKKCQNLYFKIFRLEELKMHADSLQYVKNSIAKKYKLVPPTPRNLKYFADQIRILKEEAQSLQLDEEKMKPKENQVLSEVKVFLDQHMSHEFDEEFYGGGWMFAPNHFCFHAICRIPQDINTLTFYFRPQSVDDLEFLMDTFLSYNRTIHQHIENLRLGIKSGMIRSRSSCETSVQAVKEQFKDIITYGIVEGLKQSWFTRNLQSSIFYKNLNKGIHEEWIKKHNQKVIRSLYMALIHGVGYSIEKYYQFLANEYLRYCPPDNVAAGLSSLPLNYEYFDGLPDHNKPTTGRLPLTNDILYGKDLYKKVLLRFTTLDVNPNDIYKEGMNLLKSFYAKVVKIAQQYTNERNATKAMAALLKKIEEPDQWHGTMQFPQIESNETAYKRCTDDKSAKRFCPVRWRSMEKWKNYLNRISSKIHSSLYEYFYFTGPKQTAPNCPITIKSSYKPGIRSMSFLPSDEHCTKPMEIQLPFFMERYGPRFQDWSILAHEGRPGHGFQVQGAIELFGSPCDDSLYEFFQNRGFYTGFTEGWALYAENPVMSDDVMFYRDSLLQKLGMYKWQITRAARLVIDVGLHFKNKNSEWGLNLLKKYALEKTDVATKEMTRYLSTPGHGATYMVGRLEIIKARKKMQEKLTIHFDIKEFHYQILSLGQVPLHYLSKFVNRYMRCIDDPTKMFCDHLITSDITSYITSSRKIKTNKPLSRRRHFL